MEQRVRSEAGASPLLLHPSIRTVRIALSLVVLLVANLLPLLGVHRQRGAPPRSGVAMVDLCMCGFTPESVDLSRPGVAP